MIGNNKVWAGSNKIDLTKDTTYDLSIYATKEELETVKGMIEVSARIVYTHNVRYQLSAGTSISVSIDYDYITIQPAACMARTTGSNSTMSAVVPPKYVMKKGTSGYVPLVLISDTIFVNVSANSTSITFTKADDSSYQMCNIVFYKYDT